ncbi:MAG: hypothetical protein EA390_03860 [Balneolaceae bacterium]|nr:MAG: hypothetical protein EA390_03860 [Balneolaceae bacterium]
MNRENRRSTMKREDIEAKIVDAADGRLSEKERLELEEQLRANPGLLQSYHDIMNLPDISSAYRGLMADRNDVRIHGILKDLEETDSKKGAVEFEDAALFWFRKYALAASLLILAGTSLFYVTQNGVMNGDPAFDEIFYSYEESYADNYVLYLDEWFDSDN